MRSITILFSFFNLQLYRKKVDGRMVNQECEGRSLILYPLEYQTTYNFVIFPLYPNQKLKTTNEKWFFFFQRNGFSFSKLKWLVMSHCHYDCNPQRKNIKTESEIEVWLLSLCKYNSRGPDKHFFFSSTHLYSIMFIVFV